MHGPPTANEVYAHPAGRGLPVPYPLLERVVAKYGLDAREAHAMITTYLDVFLELDGRDTVVLAQRPAPPEQVELPERPERVQGDADAPSWLDLDPEYLGFVEETVEQAVEEQAP
ncbi:hypothetical protein [Nocardiopsis ansamitocini]|uniref:Uncharacterized protein n=1 Tax=Nocardiopsis ansamitocini TaxID=1670832 RepID=A0A9W6PB81_9ACTN|nr:hypothetical protein [Nocardiopsis ansamitocini]GLU50471.1 hypothetical protein Nans01_48220 [Nocardiopsis ansamitocini]